MMSSLVVVALFGSALAAPPSDGIKRQFEDFVEQFSKEYKSAEERSSRFAQFVENVAVVERLNAEHVDAVFAVDGPFADLTAAEFKQRLMPKRAAPELPSQDVQLSEAPPASFDWRDHGAVTSVKDQGTIGACWAFSAVENIEGLMAIDGRPIQDLSAEQLIECDAQFDPKNDHADCGIFGGWPYLGFEYFMKAGGVFSLKDFPYLDGTVFSCMPEGYNKSMCGNHDDLYCNKTTTHGQQQPGGLCYAKKGFAASLSGYQAISTDETQIAAALASTAPLSVALNAQFLQFYKKGIYNPKPFWCDATSLDHAVLIVAYGTDSGLDYWTVKNSWGTKWGEDGYFRIARGNGTCGINTAVVTAKLAPASEAVVV